MYHVEGFAHEALVLLSILCDQEIHTGGSSGLEVLWRILIIVELVLMGSAFELFCSKILVQ